MSSDEGRPENVWDACSEVTPQCRVEYTVLGYYPNLGSGIFFSIAFGLCFLAALYLGIKKRTWTYCVAISIGLLLETLGYIGRALLYYNPWNSGAFQLQICAIILGPTFICVSVYLTLKHVSLAIGPELSRIPPVWYPRFFLPADLTCLVLQCIGGGVASAAGKTEVDKQKAGNNLIIAGIVLQVVVLFSFGILGFDYWFRAHKAMNRPDANPDALAVWRNAKFRKFGVAMGGAYIAILIRCVYRVIEMAGGWGNHIMQDEPSFLVLDSSLMVVATYLLTVFHPGIFFPQMQNGYSKRTAPDANDSSEAEAAAGTAPSSSGLGAEAKPASDTDVEKQST